MLVLHTISLILSLSCFLYFNVRSPTTSNGFEPES
nr:MAG TPA: hypothetical protein [Caudoviricetes sp.]